MFARYSCAMRRFLRFGVAVCAVTMALPTTAHATSKGFRTTKGAAFCVVDMAYSGDLTCWTPNDGFTVTMSAKGKARKRYVEANRDNYPKSNPTNTIKGLAFGQTFSSGPYRCKSRRTGLTCFNKGDHGWWLGRYRGYKLY